MELLDQLVNAEKGLIEYFGYKERWRHIPFEDYRGYYWSLSTPGTLRFAEKEEELFGDLCYDALILYNFSSVESRPEVHRKPDYTLVAVDPQSDNNLLLAVLDNSKERFIPEEKRDV